MLSFDLQTWAERAKRGMDEANRKNQPILVSEVIRLAEGDPFSFFSNCQEKYKGERFFWRDPDRVLTLSGAGISYPIFTTAAHRRYDEVESIWQKMLDSALLFGEKVEGTGPLLFGGFSFDPLKMKSGLWQQFSDTHLYLPSYLLTAREDGIYLTINMVINPNTAQESLLPNEGFLKQVLSQRKNIEYSPAGIAAMEEIKANDWLDSIRHAIDRIRLGQIEKVVLAREVRLKLKDRVETEAILHELLAKEKTSFIFAIESGDACFIGATPERLVRKEGSILFSTCLAGSAPRGKTSEEDLMLGDNLLNDHKNRREHQIVVDMIKAALEPVCTNLEMRTEPFLMKLPHIQHLYTPVTGVAKEEISLLGLIKKLHPTPALGGWPQEKSVELIREIEPLDRGLYGAPIGWLDGLGNGEFAVAIRSALIRGQAASLFAGCGVVADSDPEAELQETKVKIRPMLHALGGINRE